MKNIRLIVFACVAVLQLAVPVSMIQRWETALRQGAMYKFRTAPVDPYDAFRGRYVALRLESDSVPVATNFAWDHHTMVYASIAVDTNGMAYLASATTEKPVGPYLKGRALYVSEGKVQLDLPIDRFYMNEKLAPEAEQAYRQNSLRTNLNTYVKVRVLGDDAVVEDLLIGEKPIVQYLKEHPSSETP